MDLDSLSASSLGPFMIHEADPQSRPVVISTCCLYVRPTFQNLAKQKKVQARKVIATDGAVGLAEWIIKGPKEDAESKSRSNT